MEYTFKHIPEIINQLGQEWGTFFFFQLKNKWKNSTGPDLENK